MIMTKTSPVSREVLESLELRDHELALASGGIGRQELREATYYFSAAAVALSKGDFHGGLTAMNAGNNALQSIGQN